MHATYLYVFFFCLHTGGSFTRGRRQIIFQKFKDTPHYQPDTKKLYKLLLQAGYSSDIDEEQLKNALIAYQDERLAKNTNKPDVDEFATSLAQEIIQDEVEDFFRKIELATRVGGYLLSD